MSARYQNSKAPYSPNKKKPYSPNNSRNNVDQVMAKAIAKFGSDKDVKSLETEVMKALTTNSKDTAKAVCKNLLWEILYPNGPVLKFLSDEYSDAKQTYPLINYVNWAKPSITRTKNDLIKTATIIKTHINKLITRKNGDGESVLMSLITAFRENCISQDSFFSLYEFYTEKSDNLNVLHDFMSKIVLAKDMRQSSGHQSYPDIPIHRFFKDYVLMVLCQNSNAIQYFVNTLFIQLTNVKVNACVQQYWDRLVKQQADKDYNKKNKNNFYVIEEIDPKENGRYKIVDTIFSILSWMITTGPEKNGELQFFFKKNPYTANKFAPEFFNSLQETLCKIDIGKFHEANLKLESMKDEEKRQTNLQYHNINTIGALIGCIGFNERVRSWIKFWNTKCPDAVVSCIKHALHVTPCNDAELMKLIPETNTLSKLFQNIVTDILKNSNPQNKVTNEVKETQDIKTTTNTTPSEISDEFYVPPQLTEEVTLGNLDKIKDFDLKNPQIDDAIYSLSKLKKENKINEEEWCEVLLNASMALKKESSNIFVQIVPQVADSKIFEKVLKTKGTMIVETYKLDNPACVSIFETLTNAFTTNTSNSESVNWKFKNNTKKNAKPVKIQKEVTKTSAQVNLFSVLEDEEDN